MILTLVVILWITVSLLCIKDINTEKAQELEWKKYEWYLKLWFIVLMPVIYILVTGLTALEK